ncbi:hypothetical protein [Methylobacterium pseudosasicola]|uniref:Uncharacterized protein n=1 Tax=Methylobacterium pseudosasicola TaxID=582667 RepID=A0A1I4IX09_9HYPH|nr:hypothetical protein [Methylobacterium pseudosasicola]SFL58855.1 hypothetical protein SAMN05192568_100714 [Methylobacterium pseudosasicola]
MRAFICGALVFGSTVVPVLANDFERQRELNILKDIESSQRQQLELAREQAQRDKDRARREENAYVNAQRDAQSARRFDRR